MLEILAEMANSLSKNNLEVNTKLGLLCTIQYFPSQVQYVVPDAYDGFQSCWRAQQATRSPEM